MDANYRDNSRQPILVRKVLTLDGRKRRGGIYGTDGLPVQEIVPERIYYAKLDKEFVSVRAGSNQVMSVLEDVEDPRVEAGRAYAQSVGFDLNAGDYVGSKRGD